MADQQKSPPRSQAPRPAAETMMRWELLKMLTGVKDQRLDPGDVVERIMNAQKTGELNQLFSNGPLEANKMDNVDKALHALAHEQDDSQEAQGKSSFAARHSAPESSGLKELRLPNKVEAQPQEPVRRQSSVRSTKVRYRSSGDGHSLQKDSPPLNPPNTPPTRSNAFRTPKGSPSLPSHRSPETPSSLTSHGENQTPPGRRPAGKNVPDQEPGERPSMQQPARPMSANQRAVSSQADHWPPVPKTFSGQPHNQHGAQTMPPQLPSTQPGRPGPVAQRQPQPVPTQLNSTAVPSKALEGQKQELQRPASPSPPSQKSSSSATQPPAGIAPRKPVQPATGRPAPSNLPLKSPMKPDSQQNMGAQPSPKPQAPPMLAGARPAAAQQNPGSSDGGQRPQRPAIAEAAQGPSVLPGNSRPAAMPMTAQRSFPGPAMRSASRESMAGPHPPSTQQRISGTAPRASSTPGLATTAALPTRPSISRHSPSIPSSPPKAPQPLPSNLPTPEKFAESKSVIDFDSSSEDNHTATPETNEVDSITSEGTLIQEMAAENNHGIQLVEGNFTPEEMFELFMSGKLPADWSSEQNTGSAVKLMSLGALYASQAYLGKGGRKVAVEVAGALGVFE